MKNIVLSTFLALAMVSTGGCILIDGGGHDWGDDDPPYNGDGGGTGNNHGDDDDDDDDSTQGGPIGFPRTGTWEYTTFNTTQDTCGTDHEFSTGQTSGDFDLLNNMDGTFTIDPLTGADTYDCTIGDDGSFACEDHVAATTDFRPDKEAIVISTVSTSGTFDCSDSMEGTHLATITCGCEGAPDDCDRLEWAWNFEFPCQHDVAFTAVRIGSGH